MNKSRRAVKNELISVDDIDDVSGDNYCNWIKITKKKLLERESKLMSLRANILQTLISEQIAQFKVINARMKIYIDPNLYENIINQQLLDNCLDKLSSKLVEPWNGIVLNHTKNKFDTYRKYFTTSRAWFDQRKRTVLASHLWIPIFDTLQQFIKIAAKRYFNERFVDLQSKFVKSLTLQIVTNVFKQKIKLPSTRQHSLVSCSILKECHTFQMYLTTNIDENISINSLLQENPGIRAVTLMDIVIGELQANSFTSNSNFQHAVYLLYDEFNFEPVYVEPLTDYSVNITNFNRDTQINNNNINHSINDSNCINVSTSDNSINDSIDDNVSQIFSIGRNDLIAPDFLTTTHNDGMECYESYHAQSFSVISQRFSPLN